MIVLSSMPVAAHPPSSMTLDYNWDTQTLSVSASHSVADPNTHYIWNITVYKNDVKVVSRTYTSQGSTASASDTFNLAAIDGDVFRVWAECNGFGTLERTLTVTEPAPTTTTTTPTDGATTTPTDGTTTTPTDGTTTTPTDGTTLPPPPLGLETLALIGAVGFGIIIVIAAIIMRRR
jgi:hypothetical protein